MIKSPEDFFRQLGLQSVTLPEDRIVSVDSRAVPKIVISLGREALTVVIPPGTEDDIHELEGRDELSDRLYQTPPTDLLSSNQFTSF